MPVIFCNAFHFHEYTYAHKEEKEMFVSYALEQYSCVLSSCVPSILARRVHNACKARGGV
jgi:hypothetical protein